MCRRRGEPSPGRARPPCSRRASWPRSWTGAARPRRVRRSRRHRRRSTSSPCGSSPPRRAPPPPA
eukprot:2416605-Prorocentrum_lima.AAC.1